MEAFKRGNAAINRGDVEALLREVHPEVEFHAFMEELLSGANQVYSGHAGVREFFRNFNEHFDELHWSTRISAIWATGYSRLARFAPVAEEAVPRSKHRWVSWLTYDKNGIATVVLSTADPREALKAAGLSE